MHRLFFSSYPRASNPNVLSCAPASHLNLFDCMRLNRECDEATLLNTAQRFRNEICSQSQSTLDCGALYAYVEAFQACVDAVDADGTSDRPFVSSWCFGNSHTLTLSGIRGEQCMSLVAFLYRCVASFETASSTDFERALRCVARLKERLETWMNMPRQRPFPDFDAFHVRLLNAFFHAALNASASKGILEEACEALKAKAQLSRHAYETLKPCVLNDDDENDRAHPRTRALLEACKTLCDESLSLCFHSCALVYKTEKQYSLALVILDKARRLLRSKTRTTRACDELEVLRRNVSDLQSVSRPSSTQTQEPVSFDWLMIPDSECILNSAACRATLEHVRM
jgi:hypothetical protein